MLKRRVLTLSAAAVLVMTGLAGSAMAADDPTPAAGGKVVCTTSDGKTFETDADKPVAIDKEGNFVDAPEPPKGEGLHEAGTPEMHLESVEPEEGGSVERAVPGSEKMIKVKEFKGIEPPEGEGVKFWVKCIKKKAD